MVTIKNSPSAQQYIRVMQADRVNLRLSASKKISVGGQLIAPKSCTTLILDRWATFKTDKYEKTNIYFSGLAGIDNSRTSTDRHGHDSQ